VIHGGAGRDRTVGLLNAMQLVAYSLGATTLGYDPNELDYRFDYLVKTAKPELIRYPVAVGDNERRRFLKTTTRVWKAIQSPIFFPNPSYLCSSCGYQSHCKECDPAFARGHAT
jgi:putative RecB family exonuclease